MSKDIILYFLLTFILVTVTAKRCAKDDETCRELKRLRAIIKDSERELTRYKRIVEASTCNVCNIGGVNPCKNGGQCVIVPTNDTSFRFACNCPNDYAGDLCQTKLECKPDSCGVDAECNIFNHKITCTCPFGSTGDPTVSCKYKTSQACLTTDPHYTTFDGLKYNYMGTCTYYVFKQCIDNDDSHFYLTSNNALADYNPHVAWEKSFTVHAFGQEFRVDSDLTLRVNNMTQPYDYYWPSKWTQNVIITKSSNKVTVTVPKYEAVITYSNNQLCTTLPHMERFYGNTTLCGAFGNIDGDCTDDLVFSNGALASTDAKCFTGDYATDVVYTKFVDSWILPNHEPGCTKGAQVALNSNCNLNDPKIVAACAPIIQALSGQGTFAACSKMAADVIKQYHYTCLYDVCEGESKCNMLATFAVTCQQQLRFVNISSWRGAAGCPYKCEPHSHYSLSAPSCQPTCSQPQLQTSSRCFDIPEEGCVCDTGYYLDPNEDPESEAKYTCRLIEDCGCTDESGNYHLPDSSYMDINCTNLYTCKGGKLRVIPAGCGDKGTCVNNNGQGECECKPGYLKTDDSCVDIPMRHCADLYIKQNVRKSGVYTVYIGSQFDNETLLSGGTERDVYCDMETDNGGWTLFSGSNMNYSRAYSEYINGWDEDLDGRKTHIGLETMHQMTYVEETSLRIYIDRCPEDPNPILTECVYPSFSVHSKDVGYAVYIPEPCGNGNETSPYADPWVRWDPGQLGPSFSTKDNDNWQNCSKQYRNTGWWFDNTGYIGCGAANLFGERLGCNSNFDSYNGIYWNDKAIDNAYMFARPRSYPNLD